MGSDMKGILEFRLGQTQLIFIKKAKTTMVKAFPKIDLKWLAFLSIQFLKSNLAKGSKPFISVKHHYQKTMD